jgi:hypothetical protein
VVNEEEVGVRLKLPSRAATRAHAHPATPAVPAAAFAIAGAGITGFGEAILQLGLLLGGQDSPRLKAVLNAHFLHLSAKVVDFFLLFQD